MSNSTTCLIRQVASRLTSFNDKSLGHGLVIQLNFAITYRFIVTDCNRQSFKVATKFYQVAIEEIWSHYHDVRIKMHHFMSQETFDSVFK